ncbi:hypothetical protein AV955_gp076 [Diadromus pulchellus ascovirus 4a]|uniref:Complete DpAV4 genome n=1 Tax=Diadromus pulchellus ascovirus 4a TaxID=158683 RepID=F2NZ05_9VIRU|nr:hypothetical protein AV955_gp076 [Diadromus pulchellus ascovirus 4a]CCA61433.1 unnamed protein product [Diadromus pulchellus ascovirus 4a]
MFPVCSLCQSDEFVVEKHYTLFENGEVFVSDDTTVYCTRCRDVCAMCSKIEVRNKISVGAHFPNANVSATFKMCKECVRSCDSCVDCHTRFDHDYIRRWKDAGRDDDLLIPVNFYLVDRNLVSLCYTCVPNAVCRFGHYTLGDCFECGLWEEEQDSGYESCYDSDESDDAEDESAEPEDPFYDEMFETDDNTEDDD